MVKQVVCGDGQVESTSDEAVRETCDDANTVSGDGCSSECTIEAAYSCVPGVSRPFLLFLRMLTWFILLSRSVCVYIYVYMSFRFLLRA